MKQNELKIKEISSFLKQLLCQESLIKDLNLDNFSKEKINKK